MIGKLLKSPLSLAAYGVGLVRGAAATLVRAASGGGGPAHAEWIAPPEPVTEEALEGDLDEPEVVLGENLEPAPERAPGEVGEAFATEPHAVSRDSAHGGSAAVDEAIDDWYDDTDDAAGSVIEALEMGDNLPDEGPTERAILSEAETLRRAANGGVDSASGSSSSG